MLDNLQDGGTFLLTSEYDADTVWTKLPGRVQKQIIDKKLKFYVVDAIGIAQNIGLGPRINTIMQTAFFKISKVIDETLAIESIKYAIKKTYGKKGEAIVAKNIDSIEQGLAGIQEVKVPTAPTNPIEPIKVVPDNAPEFVRTVTAAILKQEGDTHSRFHDAGRRRLAVRHHPVRETQYRGDHSGMEPVNLHPVPSLLAHLPACGDQAQGIRCLVP